MRAWMTLGVIALLCVGLLAQQKPAPNPIKTTVAALLENPDKFHRKMVQVEGAVDDLKKKTSRAGNPYTTLFRSSTVGASSYAATASLGRRRFCATSAAISSRCRATASYAHFPPLSGWRRSRF